MESENERILLLHSNLASMSKDHWQVCGYLTTVTRMVSETTKNPPVFPQLSVPLLNHNWMAYQGTVPAGEIAEGSREQTKEEQNMR